LSKLQIINAGWLIDGSGNSIKTKVQLRVINGRIETIRENLPILPGQRPENSDVETLELNDATILPALVDSHVHLTMSGAMDQAERLRQLDTTGFDRAEGVIQKHLDQHLAAGVLAVRDGGDKRAHVLRYKRNQLPSPEMPVQIKSAGRAWHRPGRYGKLIGRTLDVSTSLSRAIELENDPVDHVKIVNSGLNSLSEFGKQTLAQFDGDELSAAVSAADQRGLKIMVHANGQNPVQTAVAAGCHSIEHGFFMGNDNLSLMADKAVCWVPTAVTMRAYCRYLNQIGKNPDIARKNLDHQVEQLRTARQLGVPIALGTDAGSPAVDHGIAVIDEMIILTEAGFPIEEIIRCATFNGAKLLRITDLGLLVPGMPATFIAVKGDPTGLPDSLRQIGGVYLRGELVG
jgi:imidazolonepropionase-like amidohydrolase